MGVEKPEVVTETGSGMNDKRRKLNRLLSDPTVGTIIVEHRDRLARMNAGLVESALKRRDAESSWWTTRSWRTIWCAT